MKLLITGLLTLSIFFSNIGFLIGTHFCGGEAVERDLMIGKHNIGCMMNVEAVCETEVNEGLQLTGKKCCENQFQAIELFEAVDVKPVHFKINERIFNYDLPNSFNIETHFSNQLITSISVIPPPPKRSLQIVLQSFLI